MHFIRIVAFYKVGLVPITFHELFQLISADTCKDCVLRNLIAVKMQDRKDCAIMHRI